MHARTHERCMHACMHAGFLSCTSDIIRVVISKGRTLKACPDIIFYGGAHAECGACMAQVGIPEMISFAAIIFKDDIYTQYLDQLAKLAFLGSAMHQFVFTVVSSLPYAVAQVRECRQACSVLALPEAGMIIITQRVP